MFDQMYICQTFFKITNKNTVFALLDELFKFSKPTLRFLFVCWRRLVESHGANNVAENPKKSVSLYLMRLATSNFF